MAFTFWPRNAFGSVAVCVVVTSYCSAKAICGFCQITLSVFRSRNSILATRVTRVSCRLLLIVERDRSNADGEDVAEKDGVDAGAIRANLVTSAAEEFGPHLGRDLLLDIEHRRRVGECRQTDDLDVRRQVGAAARERVAAAGDWRPTAPQIRHGGQASRER